MALRRVAKSCLERADNPPLKRTAAAVYFTCRRASRVRRRGRSTGLRYTATTVLTTIRESWGWTGLEPAAITATNAFCNVIVRAENGAYWRICPEELTCEIVARDEVDFDALWANKDFQVDWQMTRLVELAQATLGPVVEDRCYCLKLPAVLGGTYGVANFSTITRRELIAFTGDAAEQIKDVPDGGSVKIEWTK